MKTLTDDQLHEAYDNDLDETNEPILVCGLSYQPSDVLKNVDPVAYRCGFNDWLDAEVSNGRFFEVDGEYTDEEPIDEATHTVAELE